MKTFLLDYSVQLTNYLAHLGLPYKSVDSKTISVELNSDMALLKLDAAFANSPFNFPQIQNYATTKG